MKKSNIEFFLIFLFLFLFLTKNVFAGQWTKYPNNPIIKAGGGFEDHVASPAIIRDGAKLKMWYQAYANGHWNISYAESTDGLTWQRDTHSPVLTPQNEDNVIENNLVEPAVVKNDLYRMWFNSQNNGIYKIRYATSQDGISWTKHPGYVLVGESPWESTSVANPYVVYKDGKYLMWYMGTGTMSWHIGYAESADGITWTKYDKNPLTLTNSGHVGGQSVIFKDDKFHMFYHTGSTNPVDVFHVVSEDGKNWTCADSSVCSILSASSEGFDSNFIAYPETIEINSNWYLYYTGHDGANWSIGLATENPLTPASEKIPTVIIPGLFASWNKQALIYNQTVSQSDWKMNPFVHEYDGLTQTFKIMGLVENKDFYVFNYDWRKGLDSLADDLNDYLNQLVTNHQEPITNLNIVGHSLGGLVARIYAQKYGTEKINKIITLGSPHQGVAQVYKAVEAGEIDRYDDFFWLTQKLILQLNKNRLMTDKQVIWEKMPVVKDLLPTYDFLAKSDGQVIPVNDMKIKNDTLLSYNPNLPNIPNLPNLLYAFAGEKGNTLFGYQVGERTTLDKLLDYYPDGRPTKNLEKIGDYVVLSASARIGNNAKILSLGHNELIYKKEGIQEIFDILGIPYQDGQIQEGTGSTISPSLLFLVFSPVEMKVHIDNNTYNESDGLIFIPDAESGSYRLELTGKEKASYQVLIGQMGENSDVWSTIDGQITNDEPSTQVDTYQINFNSSSPAGVPADWDPTIKRLANTKAQKFLIEARKNCSKKKYLVFKIDMEKALHEIAKNKQFDLLENVEHLYATCLDNSKLPVSEKSLKMEIGFLKKTISALEKHLLWLKFFGKNVTEKALILKLAKEKLEFSENKLKERKYYYVEILVKSAQYLLKEVK